PEARPYLDVFAGTAGEPEWLARFRQQGLSRFGELGFPSRRSENWRYLDLQALEKHPMLPAVMGEPMGVPAELALESSGARLVLIDGRFAPEASRLASSKGVWFGSMQTAIAERPELVRTIAGDAGADHPFAALNAALFADGFVLDVAPDAVVDRPIEIIHLASGAGDASLHTRSLVHLSAGSRVTV